MSLDNYFRLLRSNQHKRLINPVKRIDNFSSDSDKESSDQSSQSFHDLMNEFLDDDAQNNFNPEDL
ncbi:hypothetical protein DID74_02360 [Candidatus Marinamargulisbacteria bacterium SCGC AG-333-B06]|nr:hypothetical protein DID74_02360 [Candidatus Marinamargulisbacteria bacterium SCGC AG-333-B06]